MAARGVMTGQKKIGVHMSRAFLSIKSLMMRSTTRFPRIYRARRAPFASSSPRRVGARQSPRPNVASTSDPRNVERSQRISRVCRPSTTPSFLSPVLATRLAFFRRSAPTVGDADCCAGSIDADRMGQCIGAVSASTWIFSACMLHPVISFGRPWYWPSAPRAEERVRQFRRISVGAFFVHFNRIEGG